MKNLSSQAKVGLLVLGGLLVLAYMTARIENWSVKKNDGYIIRVIFDTVAGLDEKAVVKVAGVEAGRVDKIKLRGGRAELYLRIKKDVKLRQDAKASVRSIGLLGDKYIAVTSGSLDMPLLKNNDLVEAQPEEVDIGQLAARLAAIADDIKLVTESVRGVLGGEKGRKKLQNIINNVESMSGNIDSAVT